jgi:lipopolysaccharide assembly outer membrane protein LptD (OstA)
LATALPARAQPQLRADTVEANDKERTARARGRAELRDTDFLLTADEILYSMPTAARRRRAASC